MCTLAIRLKRLALQIQVVRFSSLDRQHSPIMSPECLSCGFPSCSGYSSEYSRTMASKCLPHELLSRFGRTSVQPDSLDRKVYLWIPTSYLSLVIQSTVKSCDQSACPVDSNIVLVTHQNSQITEPEYLEKWDIPSALYHRHRLDAFSYQTLLVVVVAFSSFARILGESWTFRSPPAFF